MDKAVSSSPLKIIDGVRILVFFFIIYLTCRHSVAKHFRNVPKGHFDGNYLPFLRIVVCPILKMMAISALMVKPGSRIALFFSLAHVGAADTLIVFRSVPEFAGGIFRHIVPKPLPAYSCLKAMLYHLMAMLCYGYKMFYGMHNVLILQPNRPQGSKATL